MQAIPSWSGIGNCYDNAVAESFFATLKHECWVTTCPTLRLVRLVLFDYLERCYNPRRLHSGLGYVSPLTHETHHAHPEFAAQPVSTKSGQLHRNSRMTPKNYTQNAIPAARRKILATYRQPV